MGLTSILRLRRLPIVVSIFLPAMVTGCASPTSDKTVRQRPDVSPVAGVETGEPLRLDSSTIKPMYTELLAIDLPTVTSLAVMKNSDIRQARLAVVVSEGELERTVGAAFPAIVPMALFEHVEGTVRATEGNLVGVGFNTFQPSIAIQWIINPGRVIYDILAAKKRLAASEHGREAVVLETLRRAAIEYYSLILGQARVGAAGQGVVEAEELLRINRLRTATGVGIPADELRAEARLSARQQDLILALKAFYDASVALSVTLRLDSTVTLVPNVTEVPPIPLVRDDLPIDGLLGIAVAFRPDLQSVRTLLEAVTADKGSTWWDALGLQFQLGYQYGGITGHANNVVPSEGLPGNLTVNPVSADGRFSPNPLVNGLAKEGLFRGSRRLGHRGDKTFAFHDQQRYTASAGWRLSLSAFGEFKKAGAFVEQAQVEAERQLDHARAEVVAASQATRANRQLVKLARQQVTAAVEALRLAEANLRAGATTTLDVLQAQDGAAEARLRYAEATVHYNQSQVNLLAAIGLLNEETLMPYATAGEDENQPGQDATADAASSTGS